MPTKGYKVITVNEATYSKIADIANSLNKSIPKTVEFLTNLESAKTQETESPNTTSPKVPKSFRCDPLETCSNCIINDVCTLRSILLSDEKTIVKFKRILSIAKFKKLLELDSTALSKVDTDDLCVKPCEECKYLWLCWAGKILKEKRSPLFSDKFLSNP